jgi:5-methylcytosine-specific restriction endonuclease McrA
MKSYSRSHLTDSGLLSVVATRASLDRETTAELLADLGEIDARKLYVPQGYDSMCSYCEQELFMSEDTALRRIAVARAARKFPAIFHAVADGRLHLTAVLLLTPHLTAESADELLAAAARRTKAQLRLLLAERFPRPDVPTLLEPVATSAAQSALAAPPVTDSTSLLAPERVGSVVGPDLTGTTEAPSPRARLAPLAPDRFALQVTIDKETHDALRYAQALLGHSVPSGDLAVVLKRAARALVQMLEKQKFAKSDRSRPQRGAAKGRHVPAAVRQAVWERDGGQCTFVSEKGKRCESRTRLEWDHIVPVARGGQATIAGIRLLCRAHNQYAADRALGSEFMRRKRKQGRERTAEARAEADARAQAKEQERPKSAAEAASQQEVIPWLRALGCNLEAARTAATRCAGMVGAPLERRLFVACQGLAPRGTRRALPVSSSPA